jgi:hypothetical protein
MNDLGFVCVRVREFSVTTSFRPHLEPMYSLLSRNVATCLRLVPNLMRGDKSSLTPVDMVLY